MTLEAAALRRADAEGTQMARVAIVTGGGSGIGEALCRALAARGDSVVVADIDGASAERVAGDIGVRATASKVDVRDAGGVQALVDETVAQHGRLDIMVNNAGIAVGGPVLDLTVAHWDRIIDINLRAHIRAAKAVVPEWLERASGHFVAVASAAGLLTQLGAAPYSVTKHAAVGFAEWLAIQYGDKGIGVSCVCPMGVDTPMLRGMSDSPDADMRVAAAAVTNAGAVIGPDAVAALVVQAIADGTFLVLPQPEVLTMYQQKGADYERWIAGMRRYLRTLR